jgi:hypothetical protein
MKDVIQPAVDAVGQLDHQPLVRGRAEEFHPRAGRPGLKNGLALQPLPPGPGPPLGKELEPGLVRRPPAPGHDHGLETPEGPGAGQDLIAPPAGRFGHQPEQPFLERLAGIADFGDGQPAPLQGAEHLGRVGDAEVGGVVVKIERTAPARQPVRTRAGKGQIEGPARLHLAAQGGHHAGRIFAMFQVVIGDDQVEGAFSAGHGVGELRAPGQGVAVERLRVGQIVVAHVDPLVDHAGIDVLGVIGGVVAAANVQDPRARRQGQEHFPASVHRHPAAEPAQRLHCDRPSPAMPRTRA